MYKSLIVTFIFVTLLYAGASEKQLLLKNNLNLDTIWDQIHDVGCTSLVIPLYPGPYETIIPACSVYNFGDFIDTFVVRMKIGTVYEETDTVKGLNPGTYAYCSFPSWIVIPGVYTITCSTELANDFNKVNDRKTDTLIVYMTDYVWEPMTDVPIAPSGRKPKSGSCIAGIDTTGKIYLLKACNTSDFYSYNPTTNTWSELTPMPLGDKVIGDGKNPKHGAAIAAYEPNKSLYVLRGNNTVGFWKYQTDTIAGIDTIGWKKLANIPGKYKRCKYKAGLVTVTKQGIDYLFCMKGAKTDEFYLYNIAQDTWLKVKSPPIGASGKIGYKKGSCLAYDWIEYVYVLQGYYGSFFKYQVESDSWIELDRYNYRTYLNRDGRRKKLKGGAALVYHNNNIYMLKGGNTREFWQYSIAADSWFLPAYWFLWELPIGPTGKKKVRDGGDMIKFGDYFWALKGNNTPEFYRHNLPFPIIDVIPRQADKNVRSNRVETSVFNLTIAPNPAKSMILFHCPATVKEIKIFDVSGKIVKVVDNITNAQSHKQEIRISLKGINPGIYFLRLGKETKKFIVTK
jgi:hypothetical protein